MEYATEIVRELYRQFPELEFIDERDFGEVVELYYTFKTKPENLKKFLDNNLFVEYHLGNRLLIIRATEDID